MTGGGSSGVEGQCSASFETNRGIIEGEYVEGSYHAEMDALLKSKEKIIQRINISSAPCPRCAVVLEIEGLSDKVYVRDDVSRLGPSGNWNASNKGELVDKITPTDITAEEKEYFKDKIYSEFQGGSWYA